MLVSINLKMNKNIRIETEIKELPRNDECLAWGGSRQKFQDLRLFRMVSWRLSFNDWGFQFL